MSSRREVLIRILALLYYWTVRSIKNVALLTEDGAFALFFSSPPRGIGQLKSLHPREFAIQGSKAKKMLILGGQPGGAWAQVELTDA